MLTLRDWIVFTVGRIVGCAAATLAENAVLAYFAVITPPSVVTTSGALALSSPMTLILVKPMLWTRVTGSMTSTHFPKR